MTNWQSKVMAIALLVVVGGCAGKTIQQIYDNQGWEWAKDCQTNLKSLHIGMSIYSADYDDLLPASDWATVIFPYVKSQKYYTCPSLYEPGTTESGYSMNPAAYSLDPRTVPDVDKFVLFFESTTNVKGHTDDPENHLTTSRHAGSIYQIYLSGYVENLGVTE